MSKVVALYTQPIYPDALVTFDKDKLGEFFDKVASVGRRRNVYLDGDLEACIWNARSRMFLVPQQDKTTRMY